MGVLSTIHTGESSQVSK